MRDPFEDLSKKSVFAPGLAHELLQQAPVLRKRIRGHEARHCIRQAKPIPHASSDNLASQWTQDHRYVFPNFTPDGPHWGQQ